MEQLICHLFGDYVFQSDWMANEKTKRWLPAVIHAALYSVPFLLLTSSPLAIATIFATHSVIDHYRFARHVTFVKNMMSPMSEWKRWADCKNTGGFDSAKPPFMWVWLMIITDNSIHLAVNYLSIRFL